MPDLCIRVYVDQEVKKKKQQRKCPKITKIIKDIDQSKKKKTSMRPRTF